VRFECTLAGVVQNARRPATSRQCLQSSLLPTNLQKVCSAHAGCPARHIAFPPNRPEHPCPAPPPCNPASQLQPAPPSLQAAHATHRRLPARW